MTYWEQWFSIDMMQIDYHVNRWQQRNGSIVHDVTSVKYNKENEIFSNKLTCFPRLNKKVLKQKINNT